MIIMHPSTGAQHDQIALWIMGKVGRRAVRPYRCIAALSDDGTLMGAALFNGYNGANVDLTVYGPGAGTRQALHAIFHYAFVTLKCTRVTARTRRRKSSQVGNTPLNGQAGILARMGFVFEHCAREYYGTGKGGDAMVYRMMRAECPWLGDGYGRTRGAGSPGNRPGASRHEPGNGYHPEGLKQL